MKIADQPGLFVFKNNQSGDFKIAETLYPPKLKQPRHTHSAASLSFILSGSYLEHLDQGTFTRQPSTLIFHEPHESHAVNYGEAAVRILNVELSFSKLAYVRERSLVLNSSISCRTETISWLGRRIYQEYKRADSVSALAIEGLILETLAEMTRSKTGKAEKKLPSWLRQSRDFLHENFTQSLVLEDVVKIAGVHPVHLSRAFREKIGCTIGEYIRRLRTEYAAGQISKTRLPLGQIACGAGFADQSHLNKNFKALYGMTPSEYRRISRRS